MSHRPHIDFRITAAQSDLYIDGDQITSTIALELRNDGSAASSGTAQNVVFLPLMVPVTIPGQGMHYPPGPKSILEELCNREWQTRSSLAGLAQNFAPGEVRHSSATVGLALELLDRPGAFFEDRSFVPMFYVCTTYVSKVDRAFYQTGRAFQIRVRDAARPGETCDPVIDWLPIAAQDLVINPHAITGVLER